jgi:uncharacterized protein YcfJ
MNVLLRTLIGAASVAIAGHAAADATLYEHHDYTGKALSTPDGIDDLGRYGFGGNTASIVVADRPWQVCEGPHFSGRCSVLPPGNYRNVKEMGLGEKPWSVRPADLPPPPPPPAPPPPPPSHDGQITLYEHDGFHGRTFTTTDNIPDFRRVGFNDIASSIVVNDGRWEVCEHAGFQGRCVILRPGMYPSLSAMGFNDDLSSARQLGRGAYVPPGAYQPEPTPIVDWRPRPQERIHDVPVSTVRAVYAGPQQRCWVEQQQVVQHGDPGAGAVVGGILGGIIGHQFGNGAATVGGAVAGAVIGANVSASSGYVVGTQNVQRCANVPHNATPAYWDVTYTFRGVEHHAQMTNPPANGAIRVNEDGEPRV